MSVLNTWDEITMTNRWAVEALNRSLQDVLCNEDTVFAGKVFVFSGDFRQVILSEAFIVSRSLSLCYCLYYYLQTLPVVPKKGRPQIVNASIRQSPLWPYVTVFNFKRNMRAELRMTSDGPELQVNGKLLLPSV